MSMNVRENKKVREKVVEKKKKKKSKVS